MTKKELLTKLAMEHKEYPGYLQIAMWSGHCIHKEEWLDERERLLNKPILADAPEGVTRQAMDEDGQWCFFGKEPTLEESSENGMGEWIADYDDKYFEFATKAIAIPAGYDWRDSLEGRPV